jgi:hypothetical protein
MGEGMAFPPCSLHAIGAEENNPLGLATLACWAGREVVAYPVAGLPVAGNWLTAPRGFRPRPVRVAGYETLLRYEIEEW